MKRGITLEFPNKYGSYLGELLEPIDLTAYNFHIGGEESYFVSEVGLGDPLFPDEIVGMDGSILKEILNKRYYLIFTDLKAFPKDKRVINIETYEEFVSSDCRLILLVVDSIYVTVYCKDENHIVKLFNNALNKGFYNVAYITDDNDSRTGLSVW